MGVISNEGRDHFGLVVHREVSGFRQFDQPGVRQCANESAAGAYRDSEIAASPYYEDGSVHLRVCTARGSTSASPGSTRTEPQTKAFIGPATKCGRSLR